MVKLSKEVISLISNRIQKIREKAGLTLDEFAETIDIGRTTLYNYESEKNPIPSDVLIRISLKYKVSTDYILGLSADTYISFDDFSSDLEKIRMEIANELEIVDNMYKKVKNRKK